MRTRWDIPLISAQAHKAVLNVRLTYLIICFQQLQNHIWPCLIERVVTRLYDTIKNFFVKMIIQIGIYMVTRVWNKINIFCGMIVGDYGSDYHLIVKYLLGLSIDLTWGALILNVNVLVFFYFFLEKVLSFFLLLFHIYNFFLLICVWQWKKQDFRSFNGIK